MKKFLLVLISVILTLLLLSEVIVVKRNHAVLRSGPGSFYPIISELEPNAELQVLKHEEGWIEVEYMGKRGFVSEKISKEKKKSSETEKKMAEEKTGIKIARMGMTAGVKGFAKKLSRKLNSDPQFVDFLADYSFEPTKFRKFKKETYKKFNYKKARKLNPLPNFFNGKSVALVDDSIVRGTTLKKIVKLIRNAGVKEIHLRIGSPPVKFSCFYGIDTPTRQELIANNKTIEDIRNFIGADSLKYLTIEQLRKTVQEPENFCYACFEGNYPVK